MKRKFFLSAAALLSIACGLHAQDKVVRNVLEMGRTDNRTMEHVDFLANRIGGRPVGSHNLEDAEKWVAAQFKAWGLEVMIQEVGQAPVGFSRGPWSGRIIGGNGQLPDGTALHFVTPTYSAGTKGPQKGHVLIEPTTRAEFDRMKAALKGAWVLIGGNSNGFTLDWTEKGDSVRTAKKAEGAKDVPGLFCQEMKEAGVLGFIQAAEIPMQAHYARPGWDKLTMETLPTVCEIKLDKSQYDVIRRMAQERRDFMLEFNIRNNFFQGPVKYHNVIGIIRGSKYPDEYVLMGGHLDSYDVATGAVDDGNGVSVAMEAARMLAVSGAKPKRSMMFCIWTGEEYGLLGSRYFVEHKTVPLNKISNYFNRDGGGLAACGVSVPEAMYEDFVKAVEPVAGFTEGIPVTVNKRQGEAGPRPTTAGGSDHAYFAMNGVPTISFTERDVFGYNFNYRDIWHTETDNWNKLYPDYQNHSAVVTAVVAYGLANLPHMLSREGLYNN